MEPTGFHLYSSHIARDTSLSIYRKFAILNTRNILYLQSELADLEAQLQRLDAEGNGEEVDNDIWAISRDWRKMRDAGVSFQDSKPTVASTQESQDPRASWSVVLKIRRILKEYSRLSRLESSSDLVLTSFQTKHFRLKPGYTHSRNRPNICKN